jgi:structural maintenance of chromosome 2
MRKMLKDEIKEIQDRIKEVTDERSSNGGAYFELEEKVKELSKEIAKVKTRMNLKTTLVSDEQSGISQLNQNLEELLQSLELAKQKSAALASKCASAVEEYEGKTAALKETESLVQTLTTGLGSSEGRENGYMDQLTGKYYLIKAAKQEESQATAEIQQHKIKLSHLAKQIKADEPKAKQAKKENTAIVQELESKKNVLAMLKDQLDSITFDATLESSLLEQQKELEHQLKQLQKEISGLQSSVRSVDFQYSDPEPNFDRSKVKGFVATLFSIPKEHRNKANALEICAGGKLFQVLVESSDVGTKLLKKGKLAKRVTIIPLNQINAFQVQAERISTAKKLAPGAVDLALSLIGSDADLAKAMAYVFGSTLICKGDFNIKTRF